MNQQNHNDDIINTIIKKIVNKEYTFKSIFDYFIDEILNFHDKPVYSLIEMKQFRKTKTKGDIWEYFCKLYLQKIKKYDEVWLLKEVPDEILFKLGLKRHDYGIDIIACKNGKYSAVQCKFKRPREGLVPGTWIAYNCVNWKELSTFYALCNSTNKNNWEQHIVMTNTKYIRHMGNKSKKDKSICFGTFSKLSSLDFMEFLENQDKEDQNNAQMMEMDVQDIRLARLKFLKVDI
jgi:hypothetical protein